MTDQNDASQAAETGALSSRVVSPGFRQSPLEVKKKARPEFAREPVVVLQGTTSDLRTRSAGRIEIAAPTIPSLFASVDFCSVFCQRLEILRDAFAWRGQPLLVCVRWSIQILEWCTRID